jgi:hypothetical protein
MVLLILFASHPDLILIIESGLAWLGVQNLCLFEELKIICWYGLKSQGWPSPDCNMQRMSAKSWNAKM